MSQENTAGSKKSQVMRKFCQLDRVSSYEFGNSIIIETRIIIKALENTKALAKLKA